ncbi:hypothetical protein ACHAWF_005693, partial [Thalassiosira exigua]
ATVAAFSPPPRPPPPSSPSRGRPRRRGGGDLRGRGDGRAPGPSLPPTSPLSLSSSPDGDDDGRGGKTFLPASVAGVSVSPDGFLAILRSDVTIDGVASTVAFPVAVTSPPPPLPVDSSSLLVDDGGGGSTDDWTLPDLFREEGADRTEATTPEALTFLQLLNGVDLATPVLPPDALSSIVVRYAFSREEEEEEEERGAAEAAIEGVAVEVEDELCLSKDDNNENNNDDDENDDEFREALEYVRGMVRTTLPPGLKYADATPWQRAQVPMPRAWLRGVRLEELDSREKTTTLDRSDATARTILARVPVRFVLECSVDDGAKELEVPLPSVPAARSDELTPDVRRRVEASNEMLREISHDFNSETTPAFLSLALWHRYRKSDNGGGGGVGPTLRVSKGWLRRLARAQREGEADDDRSGSRACWIVARQSDSDDVDAIVRGTDLPLYRSLDRVREEDRRVLGYLEERNFGRGGGGSSPSSGGIVGSDRGAKGGEGDEGGGDDLPEGGGSGEERRRPTPASLTLEQRALRQKLTSAWKVATRRGDAGALEKIKEAMEDLEHEVRKGDAGREEEGSRDESGLGAIRRAVRKGSIDGKDDDGEEEEAVGLISELEAAAEIWTEEGMDTDDGKEGPM